jgi:phage shock protein C
MSQRNIMKHLVKSKQKLWSGVLAGIAEYTDMDLSVVRILYCLGTLLTGLFVGFCLYVVMAVIIPDSE